MFSEYSYTILSLIIILFAGVTYYVSWLQNKNTFLTKAYFLVANRNLSFLQSSFSIAASWIWAPALFISCQQAYTHGWQGLFWFTVPNILCLIIFAYFADIIKTNYPKGFTLSDVIRSNYSTRVQNVYWITLLGLATCAFAVQLLAGGKLLNMLLGIPYFAATILLALIPLGYSLAFGLKSSILTDFIKMTIIMIVGIILVPMVLAEMGGINTVISGLSGVNQNYSSIFTDDALTLFLSFGIPTTIGLLSGPFGDQSFWQRAFATKQEHVKKSFITGALVFGTVPILMGLIGFAAAGSGFQVKDVQLINIEVIQSVAGLLGTGLFLIIAVSVLTSILDSKLCAFSSIAGHDMSNRFKLNYLDSSRVSMIILTCLAVLVANIPDLKILYLFLFYGTLRSSTFIVTVLTLLGKKLSESGVFYGIISAIVIGLPIFTYGNITKNTLFIVTGSLTTLLLPYAITKISKLRK